MPTPVSATVAWLLRPDASGASGDPPGVGGNASPYESVFAHVNGLRLHYLEWPGGGAPVLCLPGITANAHAFAGLAEEPRPRYQAMAVDLRGRGT